MASASGGWFRWRSLVTRTVLATLLTGIIGGLLVNLVVSRLVRDAFEEQLLTELEDEALKGRTAFDEFAKLHFELTKVITEQARFVQHVEHVARLGLFERVGEPTREKRQPRWLPRRSTLRRFAKAGIYVLVNQQGKAIEYFQQGSAVPPPELLAPGLSLLLASRNENFMTFFDDVPHIVSSAAVDGDGRQLGHLLLATAINDELLASIRPAGITAETVALTTGHDARVIATSDNTLVQRGTPLKQYRERYFIFNAPVFNYEYSDLLVSYAHFVDRDTVDQLVVPILHRERLYQTLATLVLVCAFGVIALRIAHRVQRVTNKVSGFSRESLGIHAPRLGDGDQLTELETLLDWLVREVEAANREQAALRQAILEAIPMPLYYTDRDGNALGCNPAFAVLAAGNLEHLVCHPLPQPFADLAREDGDDEIALNGADGERRVFLISRAAFRSRNDRRHGRVVTMTDITENRRAADQILALNSELEARVRERTAELQASLDDLRATQKCLVEAEKMASLGELVAGVAHEINTPVGIGVTAASHLQDATREIQAQLAGGLRRSQLERFIDTVQLSSTTILSNLQRASELISGFKEVAVDRSSEQHRRFALCAYLGEVLTSLRPRIKHTPHRMELTCDEDIEMDSYPGALAQIIANLFMNAMVHGFEGRQRGLFHIQVERRDEEVVLCVSDDGRGMDEHEASHVFDPFYTTRRGRGGSGLGMHIVYNQITHTLGGRVECDSKPDEGTRFTITLPVSVPTRTPIERIGGE